MGGRSRCLMGAAGSPGARSENEDAQATGTHRVTVPEAAGVEGV